MQLNGHTLLSYAPRGRDLTLIVEGVSLEEALGLGAEDISIYAGDEIYQKFVGYEVLSASYINGKSAVEVHLYKAPVAESAVASEISAMNDNIDAFRKEIAQSAVKVDGIDSKVDKETKRVESSAKSYTDNAVNDVKEQVNGVQEQVDLNFGAIVDQALTVDETKEQAELNEGAIIEQALTLEETKQQTDVNADAITDIALTVFENHPPVLDDDEAV